MKKEIFKSVMEGDQEAFSELLMSEISEKINIKLAEKHEKTASEMMVSVDEIEEDTAFLSVVTDCLNENVTVNLDISGDERIEITPEVAGLLSETHDSLPRELQKSFRESIFDSKEKYHTILEAIVGGE